jgi:hypothetical protein
MTTTFRKKKKNFQAPTKKKPAPLNSRDLRVRLFERLQAVARLERVSGSMELMMPWCCQVVQHHTKGIMWIDTPRIYLAGE